MTWSDTEISIVRSRADERIWCGVIPGMEIQQIIDCAAPIRRCKKVTIETAIRAGWNTDFDMSKVQWRPQNERYFGEGVQVYELWAVDRS